MGFRCTHYRDPEGCELLALVMEWCELEGGCACMRMCVNGVQILKMSALSEERTLTHRLKGDSNVNSTIFWDTYRVAD